MDDCVRWTGTHNKEGRPMQGRRYAYRVLWEQERGELSSALVLHHTCENPWCVNLDHLRPLTNSEHMRLHHPRAEVCPSCGGTDWIIRTSGGQRCRTCQNRMNQAYMQRQRDGEKAGE